MCRGTREENKLQVVFGSLSSTLSMMLPLPVWSSQVKESDLGVGILLRKV